MVNIVIAGLPKNVKVPKFLTYLEKTLFEESLKVRLMNTTYNDGIKSITLNLRSNDARKVRRYLDGLVYPYAGKEYQLECWSEEVKNYAYSRDRASCDNELLPTNETYSHNSEHSKHPIGIKEELERIDLRIELLKKQRLLMEEENKLLLEKKKIEILQSIGPKDFEQLANFEKVCYRNNPAEITQFFHSAPKTKKKNSNKIPNFNIPCKLILSEMKEVLSKYLNEENHDMLMSLIYSAIRKRIVIVLGGNTYLPAPDIVHLYRIWYPLSTDTDLLDELTNTIRQSCWPKNMLGNKKNYNKYSRNVTDENTDDDKLEVTEEEMELIDEVRTNKVLETNEDVENKEVETEETEVKKVIVEAIVVTEKSDTNEGSQKSDINEVAQKSDINEVTQKSDKNEVTQKTDINEVTQKSDKNEVTQKSDINEVTQKSDINEVTQKSDNNDVIQKSDINEVTQKSDINEVTQKSDNNEVTENSDIIEVTETIGKNITEEPTTKEIVVNASVDEKPLKELANVDLVDMENDFD